jgi:predicted acylesterase/phospholipase RssA
VTDLRIALTISGAVSLGAYEGGALAALLVGVQRLLKEQEPPVRIDAIGGASAGSITGVLAARTLLAGLDPVRVMWEAWVRRDSLSALLTKDPHSPLSLEPLRATARDLLDLGPGDVRRPTQRHEIRIHMALAALRGLNYRIGRLHETPLEASTYLDWGRFTLEPDREAHEYFEPEGASVIEFALASGANAFGFAPRKLNRTILEEDQKELAKGHITNVPASGWLWYTDGGTIDNEPLGRTLDLANDVDREDPGGSRVHLLVHPHPTAPPADDSWGEPNRQPEWTRTLARAQMIQRTQSLYEDLRHLEKTNSRIEWTNRVAKAIASLIADSKDAKATLGKVLGEVRGEKEGLKRAQPDAAEAPPKPATDPGDLEDLVRRLLEEATGLAGKEPVRVEIVSPLILAEARGVPIETVLAGEFLGHFGGFLDEPLRVSDFALGYRSMLKWMEGLHELGVSAELADAAHAAANRRYQNSWHGQRHGTTTLRSLPLAAKIPLYRLAAHVIGLSARELWKKDRP